MGHQVVDRHGMKKISEVHLRQLQKE